MHFLTLTNLSNAYNLGMSVAIGISTSPSGRQENEIPKEACKSLDL